MPHVHIIAENFTEKFSDFIKSKGEQAKKWGGYAVKIVKDLPQAMQNDQNVAFAVILAANHIFFLTLHSVASLMDKQFEGRSKINKFIRPLLVDGVFVGGMTYGLNRMLSEVTKYKLSQTILIAMSLTAVSLRLILGSGCAKQKDAELKKKEKELNDKEVTLTAREQALNVKSKGTAISLSNSKEKPAEEPLTSNKGAGSGTETKGISYQLEKIERESAASAVIRGCVRKWRAKKQGITTWAELIASQKKLTVAPAMEDAPPPPPLEETFKEIYYDGEPEKEPVLSVDVSQADLSNQLKKLTPDQKEKDIGVIKEYIELLEAVLKKVVTKRDKLKQKELELCEEINTQKQEERMLAENEKRRELLESPDPVCCLYISHGKEADIECRFYNDQAYSEECAKITAANEKIRILRKSDYVPIAQLLCKQSKKNLLEAQQRVKEAQDEITKLTNVPGYLQNDVESENLKIKGKKLKTWQTRLKAYVGKETAKVTNPTTASAPAVCTLPPELIHLKQWKTVTSDNAFNILLAMLDKEVKNSKHSTIFGRFKPVKSKDGSTTSV